MQSHTPTSSDGFTLVELLISLVIVGILMAVSIPMFLTPRNTANKKLAISVAATYKQGINSFALDHSGRMPVPGTADWPTPFNAGPVEPINDPTTGRPRKYVRGIPESVSSGQIGFTNVAPAVGSRMPATAKDGIVVFVLDTANTPAIRYRLDVYARTKDRTMPSTRTCWIGTFPPPGGPAQENC